MKRPLAAFMVGAVIVTISALYASRANATFCPGPGYSASQLLDSTNNLILKWSACGSGIDFQVSANTGGWIGLAWGPSIPGPADTVQGHVVAGIPTINDAYFSSFFGWVHGVPTVDALQNISDIGGSESVGVTTLRFSRLLDTGDTAEDFILSAALGTATTFYWGIHGIDDFSAKATLGQGYTEVNLSDGATVLPEPATLALFGLGLAGLAFTKRQWFNV